MILRILEKLMNVLIDRMSPEEKEQLAERAIEQFLSAMTPEERQRLLERLLPYFFEGLDKKEFLTYVTKTLWKEMEGDLKEFGLTEKMSKAANQASDKISGILPQRIKRLWHDHQDEYSA